MAPIRQILAQLLGTKSFIHSILEQDCQTVAGQTPDFNLQYSSPLTMLRMQSIKRNYFDIFFVHSELVIAIAIALAVAGCASGPTTLRMESRSVARQLGLPDCRVSVPLSQSEIIEDAKRVGNPHPERNQDWIEITKNFQPGDQLRAVNCLSADRSKVIGDPYYYALIRNDAILLKFYIGFFN